jgi:hypothetical protein
MYVRTDGGELVNLAHVARVSELPGDTWDLVAVWLRRPAPTGHTPFRSVTILARCRSSAELAALFELVAGALEAGTAYLDLRKHHRPPEDAGADPAGTAPAGPAG